MPNWCYNNVFVSHESPEVLAGLVESFNKGEFCNHIAPMPQELRESTAPARDDVAEENEKKFGHSDWYSFATDEWGTKWDFGDEEGSLFENDDGTEVAFTFDSAWGPPIKIYSKMEELGYKVDAFYYEPGCGFCGRWVNGEEHYYDWGVSKEEWKNFLESVENDEHFQAIDEEFGMVAEINNSFDEEEEEQ